MKVVAVWLMLYMSKLITHLVDKDKKQEGPESVKPGTVTLPSWQSHPTRLPSTWQTGSLWWNRR